MGGNLSDSLSPFQANENTYCAVYVAMSCSTAACLTASLSVAVVSLSEDELPFNPFFFFAADKLNGLLRVAIRIIVSLRVG
jgi:hypothetical protein